MIFSTFSMFDSSHTSSIVEQRLVMMMMRVISTSPKRTAVNEETERERGTSRHSVYSHCGSLHRSGKGHSTELQRYSINENSSTSDEDLFTMMDKNKTIELSRSKEMMSKFDQIIYLNYLRRWWQVTSSIHSMKTIRFWSQMNFFLLKRWRRRRVNEI